MFRRARARGAAVVARKGGWHTPGDEGELLRGSRRASGVFYHNFGTDCRPFPSPLRDPHAVADVEANRVGPGLCEGGDVVHLIENCLGELCPRANSHLVASRGAVDVEGMAAGGAHVCAGTGAVCVFWQRKI